MLGGGARQIIERFHALVGLGQPRPLGRGEQVAGLARREHRQQQPHGHDQPPQKPPGQGQRAGRHGIGRREQAWPGCAVHAAGGT